MKKILTHQGVYRAEINVSPQLNISFTDYNFEIGFEIPDRDFQVSVNINSTNWISIHHIPSEKLSDLLEQLERVVIEYMVLITTPEKTIEGILESKGYSL